VQIPWRPFQHGQRVRIIRGPFCDFDAIFEGYLSGSKRVALLVTTVEGCGMRLVGDAQASQFSGYIRAQTPFSSGCSGVHVIAGVEVHPHPTRRVDAGQLYAGAHRGFPPRRNALRASLLAGSPLQSGPYKNAVRLTHYTKEPSKYSSFNEFGIDDGLNAPDDLLPSSCLPRSCHPR
jgi:hypothetical protein